MRQSTRPQGQEHQQWATPNLEACRKHTEEDGLWRVGSAERVVMRLSRGTRRSHEPRRQVRHLPPRIAACRLSAFSAGSCRCSAGPSCRCCALNSSSPACLLGCCSSPWPLCSVLPAQLLVPFQAAACRSCCSRHPGMPAWPPAARCASRCLAACLTAVHPTGRLVPPDCTTPQLQQPWRHGGLRAAVPPCRKHDAACADLQEAQTPSCRTRNSMFSNRQKQGNM
jgi:hypothetical protein